MGLFFAGDINKFWVRAEIFPDGEVNVDRESKNIRDFNCWIKNICSDETRDHPVFDIKSLSSCFFFQVSPEHLFLLGGEMVKTRFAAGKHYEIMIPTVEMANDLNKNITDHDSGRNQEYKTKIRLTIYPNCKYPDSFNNAFRRKQDKGCGNSYWK